MYSSEKILQVIGYILSLNAGKMNLLKLMKELYLIDRQSIELRETSISGDTYFSMDHGPILSYTLNLLSAVRDDVGFLSDYIDITKGNLYKADVKIKKETTISLLSKRDLMIIEDIHAKFLNHTPKEIEDYTHELPEWKNPSGSSVKIRYSDIMKALGRTDEDIAIAKSEYEAISNLIS